MGRKVLVLSGGGAKGSFELGAIDYLINDREMNFDILAGISTGTLNAVMLAHKPGYDGLKASLQELKTIWLEKIRGDRDVYKKNFLGLFSIAIFGADSLYNFEPLSNLYDQHVDVSALQASDRVLLFGTVDLYSGKYFVVKKDRNGLTKTDPETDQTEGLRWDVFKDHVVASASIPFALPPVRHNTQRLVDGGNRNITPLGDAFDALKNLGESQPDDEIYVVLASPRKISGEKGKLNDGLEIAKRAVSILENEVYVDDLKGAANINRAIKANRDLKAELLKHFDPDQVEEVFDRIKFPFADHVYARLNVIEPEKEYLDALEFDPAKIKESFAAGRVMAQRVLESKIENV